jgi:sugar lactone lactonase YvrE
MIRYDARVLFRPPNPELRFLPEGPYPCGPGVVSWVAIQHGAGATHGSLNLLDVTAGSNRSIPLEGRPGFAFPTTDPEVFLVGCEKRVGFFDPGRGGWVGPSVTAESDVDGTILNDAVFHGDLVIFGTKDLAFSTPRAGLYSWQPSRDRLRRLADRQICSNGKAVLDDGEGARLLDIDSPTRHVVEYPLDLEEGTVGAPRIALDLTDDPAFPDGMILTPDGKSVVIAFYHPDGVEAGEARQYDLATGEVQMVWRTGGSPQVTCPQWVGLGGRAALVLTTAVEHMTPERLARCPNAGALFVADTPWSEAPAAPRFPLPAAAAPSRGSP